MWKHLNKECLWKWPLVILAHTSTKAAIVFLLVKQQSSSRWGFFLFPLQYNVGFYVSPGPTPGRVVGQHTDALFRVPHSREIKCSCTTSAAHLQLLKPQQPCRIQVPFNYRLKAQRAAASWAFLFSSAGFDSLQLLKQSGLVQACVEESSFHAWNCNYVLFFQAASGKRCLPVCII